MSETLVHRLFVAVDSGNWTDLVEIFHPEIVYERPGYPAFEGRARVMQFYTSERIMSSGKHYPERVVIEGNYGACWGRFIGTNKDGSPINERFADVYTFEDDKIKARKSYFFRPAI